jgi:hypothetical protein
VCRIKAYGEWAVNFYIKKVRSVRVESNRGEPR